jgi:hypothetical protein
MIEVNTSYQDYAEGGHEPAGEDRIPLGFALLAMLGLSAIGWAIILVPLVTLFN